MKAIIFVSFFSLFSFGSCKSVNSIRLTSENFTANNLNLNGYYFTKNSSDEYSVFFLYKNGIVKYEGIFLNVSDLENLDKRVSINPNKDQLKYARYLWGFFKVRGSQIEIERWLSDSSGAYPVEIMVGEIINDVTFVIKRTMVKQSKIDKTVNQTYHFRQFSPKPDSTNFFIK